MIARRKCYLIGNVLSAACPVTACIRIGRTVLAVAGHISSVLISYNAYIAPCIVSCLRLIGSLCIQKSAACFCNTLPCLGIQVIAVDHIFYVRRNDLYICDRFHCAAFHCSRNSHIAVRISFERYSVKIPCYCFLNFFSSCIDCYSIRKIRCLAHNCHCVHFFR